MQICPKRGRQHYITKTVNINCEKYVPVSLSSIKIIKSNNFGTWISIHLECGGFIIITFRLFILLQRSKLTFRLPTDHLTTLVQEIHKFRTFWAFTDNSDESFTMVMYEKKSSCMYK